MQISSLHIYFLKIWYFIYTYFCIFLWNTYIYIYIIYIYIRTMHMSLSLSPAKVLKLLVSHNYHIRVGSAVPASRDQIQNAPNTPAAPGLRNEARVSRTRRRFDSWHFERGEASVCFFGGDLGALLVVVLSLKLGWAGWEEEERGRLVTKSFNKVTWEEISSNTGNLERSKVQFPKISPPGTSGLLETRIYLREEIRY